MHKAEDVARYIVNQSIREHEYIYCAHLQGLLVLAQYAHLHEYNELLYQEAIIYKKLGPRVEEISRDYPALILNPVTSYCEFEFENDLKKPFNIDVINIVFDENIFSPEEKELMNRLIEKYADTSYHQLLRVNEEYYQLIKEKTRYVDIVREYKKDSKVNEKWIKTS